jgi:putative transposase
MADYRRTRIPGGTYFFTVVTFRRQPLLVDPDSRRALRDAVELVRRRYPFAIDAWVLLPDHTHCVWTLPPGDSNYSKRWGMIKAAFSKRICARTHCAAWMSTSKRKHRETTVWQRRFWEHCVRDEADYRKHLDYIHFNPVKHGLVTQVRDWPYSTFHRYVQEGMYAEDWGGGLAVELSELGE